MRDDASEREALERFLHFVCFSRIRAVSGQFHQPRQRFTAGHDWSAYLRRASVALCSSCTVFFFFFIFLNDAKRKEGSGSIRAPDSVYLNRSVAP